MAHDSRKSRDASRFDAYRIDLMRRSVPIQKEARKEWFERFTKLVEDAFPEPKKLMQKPGMATRLFASEIEVPHSHPRDLEAMAQHLDLLWEASTAEVVKEFRTLITPDRRDLVWEFVADLGGSYVTGAVKLRNYSLDREERSDRPPFRHGGRGDSRGSRDRDDRGGRPPYRDRDDRGGRPPYRDRDDRGGRPSYRDRDDRGGRPSYRDRDGQGGRPPYRGNRDDRGGRPSYRDRDDRSGRPPYRDRDDRGGRPSYRERDDRGGRPPYRGGGDRDNRGGRPYRGSRDSGGSRGRPPGRRRPPKR